MTWACRAAWVVFGIGLWRFGVALGERIALHM